MLAQSAGPLGFLDHADQLGQPDHRRVVPDDHPAQRRIDLSPPHTRQAPQRLGEMFRRRFRPGLVYSAHLNMRAPVRTPCPPTTAGTHRLARQGRCRCRNLRHQSLQPTKNPHVAVVSDAEPEFACDEPEVPPAARCVTTVPIPIAAATGHSINDNAANAPRPP